MLFHTMLHDILSQNLTGFIVIVMKTLWAG